MTTLEIFQIALLALPKVTVGVNNFISWMRDMHSELERTKEMTPELRAAFRAALLSRNLEAFELPD